MGVARQPIQVSDTNFLKGNGEKGLLDGELMMEKDETLDKIPLQLSIDVSGKW